jgi:hypothetical protein
MRVDHVVADLELDMRKRLELRVLQVRFDWLCDGFLLFPAEQGASPADGF